MKEILGYSKKSPDPKRSCSFPAFDHPFSPPGSHHLHGHIAQMPSKTMIVRKLLHRLTKNRHGFPRGTSVASWAPKIHGFLFPPPTQKFRSHQIFNGVKNQSVSNLIQSTIHSLIRCSHSSKFRHWILTPFLCRFFPPDVQ